ncbi:phosphotransferase [Enemella sp. A6]|uniref:phosphotransferase n=1 Tax=Enemella sp. A6 TaxID=3440152 RepID=UPI003EB7523E
MDHDRAARLLAAPRAQQWVRSALGGDLAGRQVRVELDRVHHRPDADATAGFHVTVTGGGPQRREYVVATTAELAGSGFTVVEHEGLTLRLWEHPADPRLPALAGACDVGVVGDWLGAEVLELDLIAYRPLRRAVLRAVTAEDKYYIKLLLPERAGPHITRHRVMAEAGVAPEVIAEPAPGVLIVAGAAGEPLAERFAAIAEGKPAPDPADIVQLLDRLPHDLLRVPKRSAWTDRLDFHAAAAAVALPEAAEEIEQLAVAIDQLLAERPRGPVVPVHGDLYEANVFVREVPGRSDRYTLIDLDTAGPGHRVDDLACVLAHLAVLPDLSPAHYAGLIDTLENWTRHFAAQVDPGALYARVAGVILTLIAGADRAHALARLDLVRSWLQRAQLAE